jgi:hypothetical protein
MNYAVRFYKKRDPQRLSLDFTIHRMSIIYHEKSFRFDSGIAVLILAITAEVEHSLRPHRKAAGSSSIPDDNLSGEAQAERPHLDQR